MRTQLNDAFEKARKLGYVYLLTADNQGHPHMSIVQMVNIDDNNRLKLMAWLCQYSRENIYENTKVTVVIWNPADDTGYQILGNVTDIQEAAELDGYAMGIEEKKHFPQIEWKIWIDTVKVFNFQKAPHIDVEA